MNVQAMLKPMPAEPVQKSLEGLAVLGRMAASGVDMMPLQQDLLNRAIADPSQADILMDLSTILQLTGNRDAGLAVQAQALESKRLYQPPLARPAVLRLLALMAPGDFMANTPIEFILEGADVQLDLLYLLPGEPLPATLPEHDVLLVGVGESEQNLPLLKQLAAFVPSAPRPVLNAPDRIARLSRDGVWQMLKGAPGIEIPMSARIPRGTLAKIGEEALAIGDFLEDGVFPIIARPTGSHAGIGLVKIDSPALIGDYLASRTEDDFYISRFVDYSGADGLFGKYRIVLIKGRPFICHLAISSEWMVHYLNAGMTESAEKRAEEARVMATFDDDFARRHATAFRAIAERSGLDYIGIDCAETKDGKLLVFEIDTAMIIHDMDPAEMFPYKGPQMRKVFDAFRDMLVETTKA